MSYGNEQRGGSGFESGAYQEKREYRDQGGQGSQRDGGYQHANRGGGGYGGGSRGGGGGGYGQRGGFGGNRDFRGRQEDPGPARLYKPYVGTSNQNPPTQIVEKAARIAKNLERAGYTVRTSGMEGLDDEFEKVQDKELILPWRNFRDKESRNTFTEENAKILARQYHPKYDEIKPAAQTFLAKNVRLILGQKLKSPAQFAVIWTEDGIERVADRSPRSGNMGHLVAIAADMRIPVFNLALDDAEDRLYRYLGLTNAPGTGPAPTPSPDRQQERQPDRGGYGDNQRQGGYQGNQQGREANNPSQNPKPSQGEHQYGQHNHDRGQQHEQRQHSVDDDFEDIGY